LSSSKFGEKVNLAHRGGPGKSQGTLRRAVGRGGYFALAFGAMVGSGWVIVLGDWLRVAGPGGTVVGFIAGAVAMSLICLCYGELASRHSSAGAEFLYALDTFGERAGFMVAWFLTLFAVAVCAFEAIACAWLLRALFPSIALAAAYSIAGGTVSWDALLIGLAGAIAICLLHLRGAVFAIRFQSVATYGFLGICAVLVLTGVVLGSTDNLQPLWETGSGGSWVQGSMWVFATCAFFLNCWQTALHALEERKSGVTITQIVHCMLAAIFAGAAFYIMITVAASMAIHWPDLLAQDVPAAAAFRALGLHGILGTIILGAAIMSVFKTWSAMVWIGSRLLYAQARHDLLPPLFANVDSTSGAPRAAIAVVTILSMVGLGLGRSALVPIVDMVSISLAFSLVFCLIVLLRRRSLDDVQLPYRVPGGTPTILCALACAVAMIGIATVEPLLKNHGAVPLEWVLLAAWAALGMVVWICTRAMRRRGRNHAPITRESL
jgi:basic amino acid/polyamine antiporter, APA family